MDTMRGDVIASRVRAALALAKSAETHPVGFWASAARKLEWSVFPPPLLRKDGADETKDMLGLDALFTGGKLNTGYLCSDHHVKHGRGNQQAVLFESPMAKLATRTARSDSDDDGGGGGVSRSLTYGELASASSSVAGGLLNLGVTKGDTVLLYMPSTPEAITAALACAKIGATHAIVFGGFAASQLATRIALSRPKVIITTRYALENGRSIAYKPIVDEAISSLDVQSQRPAHVLIVDREGEGSFGEKLVKEVSCPMTAKRDIFWRDLAPSISPLEQAVELDGSDVLYTLFTSGTTATPKGVQRKNGGHAVALKHSMDSIMGCDPGDVYFAAADLGWVVGHSYGMYAPLLHGCTTLLYEGKPVNSPDAAAWWRLIQKHAVSKVFAAPSGVRAIIRDDPSGALMQRFDLSSLQAMFLAGERLDPATREWLTRTLPSHVEVLDQWWQTETGWAIASNPSRRTAEDASFPTKPGSAGVPSPSFNVRIVSDDGEVLPPGVEGNIVLKLPLPPGCATNLLRDDDGRYNSSYLSRFPGFYDTGDGGMIDDDGYVHVLGRNDDVLTISGHRLSTGSLEAAVSKHPIVAEVAVVGVHDDMKTERPVSFVVLKAGDVDIDKERVQREIKLLVRREVSSIASLKTVVFVHALPKTRSGKVLRRVLRDLTKRARDTVDVPATIENAAVVDDLARVIAQNRIGPYHEALSRTNAETALQKHPTLRSGFRALVCDALPPDDAGGSGGGGIKTSLLRFDSLTSLPAQDDAADVLVRVTHSTLNYKDGIVLSGRPGVATQFPLVPGIDFCGEVLESSTERVRVGDRVVLTGHYMGQHVSGGLAEVCRVNSDWLVPLEHTGLSQWESMAVGTAGFTAMQAVDALERAGLSPTNPTPVLVTGAGGGVGSFTVSILARRGYNVVACTGRVEQLREYLVSLGASKVVDRLTPSDRPLMPEEFAAAVDTVGSSLASILPRMTYGGLVASCGNAGGGVVDASVNVFPFILRGVTLIGIDSVQLCSSERLHVWSRFNHHEWKPDIPRIVSDTIRLEDVPDVVPKLMNGAITGRVVVEIASPST